VKVCELFVRFEREPSHGSADICILFRHTTFESHAEVTGPCLVTLNTVRDFVPRVSQGGENADKLLYLSTQRALRLLGFKLSMQQFGLVRMVVVVRGLRRAFRS